MNVRIFETKKAPLDAVKAKATQVLNESLEGDKNKNLFLDGVAVSSMEASSVWLYSKTERHHGCRSLTPRGYDLGPHWS